jgi:hypothetical protein
MGRPGPLLHTECEAHPENIYRGKSRNRPLLFIRLISFYKEGTPGTDTDFYKYWFLYIEEFPGTDPPHSTFKSSAVYGINGEYPNPCFVSPVSVVINCFYPKTGA